jgi:uncharacterized protein RhaS with RHS repeats
MTRSNRINLSGYAYHVICRADQDDVVFTEDKDKERFLEYLGEYAVQFAMRILNGSHLKYAYDSRGRLSTLTHYPDNETYTWNYNSDNTVSRIDYPNDIENYFTYDDLYRLSRVRVSPESGVDFYSVDYTYEDAGNRTKAEWDSTEFETFQYTKNYAYDNLYQLMSERKMNHAEYA